MAVLVRDVKGFMPSTAKDLPLKLRAMHSTLFVQDPCERRYTDF